MSCGETYLNPHTPEYASTVLPGYTTRTGNLDWNLSYHHVHFSQQRQSFFIK